MSNLLPRARVIAGAAALIVTAAALVGCQPEPAESPTATPTATSTATPTPTAEPTVEPTTPASDIALPASCEQIYSPAMLASLNEQNPPLNDPGVTMNSTQVVVALELLDSGIPSIRCSWGRPSESGLATNVSLLDADQSAELLAALQDMGFDCSELEGGTQCTLEREMLNLDDDIVHLGETHYLRGNGWVSTAWVNFAPDGYTRDIVATLW